MLSIFFWFLSAAITADAQYLRRHRRINYVFSNDGSDAVSSSRSGSKRNGGGRGDLSSNSPGKKASFESDTSYLSLPATSEGSSESSESGATGKIEADLSSLASDSAVKIAASVGETSREKGPPKNTSGGKFDRPSYSSSGDATFGSGTKGGAARLSHASAGEASSESGTTNAFDRDEANLPSFNSDGETANYAPLTSSGKTSSESGETRDTKRTEEGFSSRGSGGGATIDNWAAGDIEGGGEAGGDGGVNTSSATNGRGEANWQGSGDGNGVVHGFGGGNVFGNGLGYGQGYTFGKKGKSYSQEFTDGQSFGDVVGGGGGQGLVKSFASGQKASGGGEGTGTGFGTGMGAGSFGASVEANSDGFAGKSFTEGRSFGDVAKSGSFGDTGRVQRSTDKGESFSSRQDTPRYGFGHESRRMQYLRERSNEI